MQVLTSIGDNFVEKKITCIIIMEDILLNTREKKNTHYKGRSLRKRFSPGGVEVENKGRFRDEGREWQKEIWMEIRKVFQAERADMFRENLG